MTAYDNIEYDESTVFFMSDGTIVGDNWSKKSSEEERGLTTLASLPLDQWTPYSTVPTSFWHIANGQFVKDKSEADIQTYHNLQEQLMVKEQTLIETQETFEKFIDGMISKEDYETTRLQRIQLRTDIDNLKAQIRAMEK